MATERDVNQAFDLYCDLLFRLCMIRLHNREDAEDAVSETFLCLYRSDKVFDSEEHRRAWLISVACRKCGHVLAQHWHRHRVDYEAIPEPADDPGDAEILRLLAALPVRLREPLYLNACMGYDAAEIAQILHISQSAVYYRLQRARTKMRLELDTGGLSYEKQGSAACSAADTLHR